MSVHVSGKRVPVVFCWILPIGFLLCFTVSFPVVLISVNFLVFTIIVYRSAFTACFAKRLCSLTYFPWKRSISVCCLFAIRSTI